MKKLEYQVSFATPAFLGNAEQNGQWRTPPFKALLRQWWRVAETAGRKPVTAEIQRREGELFGRAAVGRHASHCEAEWPGHNRWLRDMLPTAEFLAREGRTGTAKKED